MKIIIRCCECKKFFKFDYKFNHLKFKIKHSMFEGCTCCQECFEKLINDTDWDDRY
jgi:hypothetical protein